MALINRITRLFRTDMHAVLDRLEDPEFMLKQAVREMEEAIAAERRRLTLLEEEQVETDKNQEALNNTLERIKDEIDVCLTAKDEELARKVLKRKLQTEKLLSQISDRASALGDRIVQSRDSLTLHEDQLASMQQKARLFSQEVPPDSTADCISDITDADVEVALLQEMQRRAS